MNLDLLLIIGVILTGFFGLGIARNIVKTIICLNICNAGIVLFFLYLAYSPGKQPPINPTPAALMVDPVPQALMITAIVLGAATTAVCLMLSIKLFHHYGTLEWRELTEREG